MNSALKSIEAILACTEYSSVSRTWVCDLMQQNVIVLASYTILLQSSRNQLYRRLLRPEFVLMKMSARDVLLLPFYRPYVLLPIGLFILIFQSEAWWIISSLLRCSRKLLITAYRETAEAKRGFLEEEFHCTSAHTASSVCWCPYAYVCECRCRKKIFTEVLSGSPYRLHSFRYT